MEKGEEKEEGTNFSLSKWPFILLIYNFVLLFPHLKERKKIHTVFLPFFIKDTFNVGTSSQQQAVLRESKAFLRYIS